MIRGILIDLDDTLADDRFATDQAVLEIWKSKNEGGKFDAEALKARWAEITDRHWRRFRNGQTTVQGQRRARMAELFEKKFSDDEADALFERFLGFYERNWRLTEGASEFLSLTSGLPKVIVTNCEANQASSKVARLNISIHFVGVVTPEDAGASKPKPGIFRHALGLLGLPASDCLMIGDSDEYDIEPARALGMSTFLVGGEQGLGLAEAARAA
jgi:putative hydrolase of the HAD superfamily